MRVLRSFKITAILVCFLALPIVGFWSGRRYCEVMNAVEDCRSGGGFAQIRCMLLCYHEQHGAFPPTRYQPEANGPTHSWRVLLVPYTEADFKERYSKYDFSQEWNSQENMQAIGDMPHFSYFSMDVTEDADDLTDYVAIGEGDDWPSKNPLKSCLITKGEDRFLVVEYPDCDIHWMEPKY